MIGNKIPRIIAPQMRYGHCVIHLFLTLSFIFNQTTALFYEKNFSCHFYCLHFIFLQ